eukprot:g26366.t1
MDIENKVSDPEPRCQDLAKLLEVFPCAKVVMSYRKSLEDQLLSQSFALGDFQYFVTQQANQAMKSFAEAHRDRVYSLAMEDRPLTPDMALCCGADMMATKVSAEKPMLMAHLVEDSSKLRRPGYAGSVGRSVTGQDFPVAPEFLTSMSGQLLSVQQVIEDVNLKIAQLQEQINSRLGQQLPREVTRQSGSEKISLPENFRDLDIMVERESNSSGRRKGIAFEEPSPEDEEQDDEEEQAFQAWPRKKQLTVREFLDLRANSAFLEGAAQDIVETAEALNRALDEENRIYKYENDRDTLRKRHMMNMVRLVMDAPRIEVSDEWPSGWAPFVRQMFVFDLSHHWPRDGQGELVMPRRKVGIVAVIAVNAVCIGVSADHPGAVGWEILELVFFGIYFLEFVIKAGFLDKCNYWVGPDWSCLAGVKSHGSMERRENMDVG